MTRKEFEKKFAHVLDEHVNADMAHALDTLLDDYDTAMGGAYELLSDMPTSLSDMLDKETMAAYRRLCGKSE
jgi:hypothetical protein